MDIIIWDIVGVLKWLNRPLNPIITPFLVASHLIILFQTKLSAEIGTYLTSSAYQYMTRVNLGSSTPVPLTIGRICP